MTADHNRVFAPSRLFLTISATGLACELAIAESTLLPDAPTVPLAAAFILFPIALAVFGRTVWVGVRGARRPTLSDLLGGLPAVAILTFFAFLVFAWAVSFTDIAESRGQPTEQAGHFYLNDHGDYIPVSRAEYRHAQALTERTFTLIPSVLFAFAVLVNLPRDRRSATEQPARSDPRE